MFFSRFRYSFILILLPLLTQCGSPYSFGPIKYGSSAHLEFRDRTRGGLMGDGADTLLKQHSESVIIGFEHFSDGERTHNHIYRGAVKFNLGLLNEPPPKTITKAILNYTVETGSTKSDGGFITSCATKLLFANSDWHGIPEVDIEKADDTISGTIIPGDLPTAVIGTKVSVDVTAIVKDWVAGKVPNNGFVFAGDKEDKGIISDNEKCWTILGGFSLKVDYTK